MLSVRLMRRRIACVTSSERDVAARVEECSRRQARLHARLPSIFLALLLRQQRALIRVDASRQREEIWLQRECSGRRERGRQRGAEKERQMKSA